MPRTINGGGDNWCTPSRYIEAAIKVMGAIDLDPASNELAKSRIPAGVSYTVSDDGLSKEWKGRVWLNPPYSQPLMKYFIEKFLSGVKCGVIEEGIVLTHNNTDTSWWHNLALVASAICFTRGRISFEKEDGAKKSPTQGQTFFYFGRNPGNFEEVFKEFGFISFLIPKR